MWEMVATLDLEHRLQTVTCPVLIVAGQDDASAPPAAGQLIADRVPNATLKVLPQCGHFPPIEYPAEFNTLLRTFLERR
jgi:3-oxoadipate enol-lactonase